MSRHHGTFSGDFLNLVGQATGFFQWPIPGTAGYAWKQLKSRKGLRQTVYILKKQGLISVKKIKNQQFLELTSKGQLELLLSKAVLVRPEQWDGYWRLIIFDIPEDSRDKRALLRGLLKKNGFIKLQASVFVSPYPLNREAVAYLKSSGLSAYIRIIKVMEIDDDSDLKKKFSLK